MPEHTDLVGSSKWWDTLSTEIGKDVDEAFKQELSQINKVESIQIGEILYPLYEEIRIKILKEKETLVTLGRHLLLECQTKLEMSLILFIP